MPSLAAVGGSTFAGLIAARIQTEHQALAMRWLQRLTELLPVDAPEVFPSGTLLDHIPELIQSLGAGLITPEPERVAANTQVMAKARELGQLRYAQRASVHQLMREYEFLGDLLEAFVRDEAGRMPIVPTADEALDVARHLAQGLRLLMQVTIDTFVTEYTETISRQRERLEHFNRLASHELRQPLGTLHFAVHRLKDERGWVDEEARARVLALLDRNIARAIDLVGKLRLVAGIDSAADSPSIQKIELTALAREVARQLTDLAESHGVTISVDNDLPAVVVDVAQLELVLVNLVSNAIKYSDPAKPARFVDIGADGMANPSGAPSPGADSISLIVRDNGVGIPAEASEHVFDRFFRGHSDRDAELGVDGLGLGLSIVRDCVHALGGAVRVESREGEGTTFIVTFPVSAQSPA